MKTGLILEGGAMRGLFTCGVIDVFLENNIEFDGAIGTSAGACFGCNIKSKQHQRPYRYNMEFCNDKRYCSIESLIKTGDLYNVDFCYEQIPYHIYPFDEKAFEENPMEFYVTCTDVETGKAVYYKCRKGGREDGKWIRASASMPLVSRIVEIGNRKLLDGGIADSIPIRFFESIGYDHNVVVLTQPRAYVKKKNKLLPILKVVLRKYPKIINAIRNRHIKYNQTTEYIKNIEKENKVFVICPKESLEIGSTEKNPKELERVYQLGREAALEQLEALKEYIKK
ncbi:MAG: patatin family protein [Holdemanella sp.]|nr:patatin family protein [Holdemanella sp.]